MAQTTAAASSPAAADLWSLARQQSGVHRFSTLFTAQDVRGRLANENFNDQPAEVELKGRKLEVEARGWQKMWAGP
ncbi:MAG TPA: hypothetical protein PKM43_09505 [Verrucomicrobiota bacterium]|nr:hypothetical protein [Verrucomicrobiota bacterium]HRZ38098.1 hypothetical protein [Candidatus Paceibacterota bacterium]HRZ56060.1 hypothetical protein [Candidatus Paceibacterota bacterium]